MLAPVSQQQVGNPEPDAIDEHHLIGSPAALQCLNQAAGFFNGMPAFRPLPAVLFNPHLHFIVTRPGGGNEHLSPLPALRHPLGKAAFPAPGAAGYQR